MMYVNETEHYFKIMGECIFNLLFTGRRLSGGEGRLTASVQRSSRAPPTLFALVACRVQSKLMPTCRYHVSPRPQLHGCWCRAYLLICTSALKIAFFSDFLCSTIPQAAAPLKSVMTQESSPHSASAPSTFSSPSLSTATTESVGGRRRSRDLMIDEDTPMSSSASAPSLPPANSSLSPHHSSEQQHQQPSMVRRSSGSSYSKRESFVRTPEDSFRDEIVRQIFGENLGCIRDDASCAVESKILLHGRIYITDKFVW